MKYPGIITTSVAAPLTNDNKTTRRIYVVTAIFFLFDIVLNRLANVADLSIVNLDMILKTNVITNSNTGKYQF